jgi:hypothetical protein
MSVQINTPAANNSQDGKMLNMASQQRHPSPQPNQAETLYHSLLIKLFLMHQKVPGSVISIPIYPRQAPLPFSWRFSASSLDRTSFSEPTYFCFSRLEQGLLGGHEFT